MPEGTSLVNLGELSKPATVLVEKISDAIGGIFRPYQIRRIAHAEADAKRIESLVQIEVSELQQRALKRFLAEEARKQDNMEAITAKALPEVGQGASPKDVEDDWISNFFDKCRLISNDEMQQLWARVLAGEANSPGTFSKRTVNYLASLDKSDAELFRSLCSFICISGPWFPMIMNIEEPLYEKAGLSFVNLKHLDDVGLVRFDNLSGFQAAGAEKRVSLHYFDQPIVLEYKQDSGNTLDLGKVLLSKVGLELAPISAAGPVEGFLDYLVQYWKNAGISVSLLAPGIAPKAPPLQPATSS